MVVKNAADCLKEFKEGAEEGKFRAISGGWSGERVGVLGAAKSWGRTSSAVGDGHTNIYPTRDAKVGFHTLPLAFTLVDDEHLPEQCSFRGNALWVIHQSLYPRSYTCLFAISLVASSALVLVSLCGASSLVSAADTKPIVREICTQATLVEYRTVGAIPANRSSFQSVRNAHVVKCSREERQADDARELHGCPRRSRRW